METEVVEMRFPVTGKASLKIGNIRGSIQIQAGDEQAIHVQAVKYLKTGDADRTHVEISQTVDGTVLVEARFANGFAPFGTRNEACRVDFDVSLPETCQLQVSSVSSSVFVQGLTGSFHLEVVSGMLMMEDLQGDLRLSCVSGPIHGERLAGTLEMEVVSGNVELRGCQLDKLRAATVSGDIYLETSLSGLSYKINSISGDVVMACPAGTGCFLSSHSMSGEAKTAFPATLLSSSNRGREYQIGEGGPRIEHNSLSGDFLLRALPNAAGDSPSQATADIPSPSRLEILEQISRGEISAEQGLAAMRAAAISA